MKAAKLAVAQLESIAAAEKLVQAEAAEERPIFANALMTDLNARLKFNATDITTQNTGRVTPVSEREAANTALLERMIADLARKLAAGGPAGGSGPRPRPRRSSAPTTSGNSRSQDAPRGRPGARAQRRVARGRHRQREGRGDRLPRSEGEGRPGESDRQHRRARRREWAGLTWPCCTAARFVLKGFLGGPGTGRPGSTNPSGTPKLSRDDARPGERPGPAVYRLRGGDLGYVGRRRQNHWVRRAGTAGPGASRRPHHRAAIHAPGG